MSADSAPQADPHADIHTDLHADPHATPRSVVIANAGSGKTFTLANRILRWSIDALRAGREPEPARILAVTFTRKAAGEILARILAHAAQGATEGAAGDDARRAFRDVVGDATRDEYLRVLEALCAELHRLQVGTIDGFFHRVASALPDEVGLPPEWTVGDEREIEELRATVAARILAAEGAEELLDLLEEGAPKPSVTRAITTLLGGTSVSPLDIYRATAVRPGGVEQAWGWAERLERPGDLRKDRYDALVERFAALPLPTKRDGTPRTTWTTQCGKCVPLLRQRDFRALAGNGFFWAMAKCGSYSSCAVPEEFTEVATQLAAYLRDALVESLVDRLRGAMRVLPAADAALAAAQAESGLFSFGDIGRGVARAAQSADSRVARAEALREALGADIRDLAIDEAQDTSVEQFLAMRPLLDEVLSGARDGRFLLVGDPKQSIYGWRGGTPGLVAHIERTYAGQLGAGVALTRSYRSSPLVMDFVNRVFGNLERDLLALVPAEQRIELIALHDWARAQGLPDDATAGAFQRAVSSWRFARHEAARPDIGGRIAFYACGEPDDASGGDADGEAEAGGGDGAAEDAREAARETAGGGAGEAAGSGAGDGDADAAKAAADHIETPAERFTATDCAAAIAARIQREAPERTVGILVRTNREIADTIAALRALGVAASDEGRATLLDSPAVAGVVAMLRLIDTPGDRISHFLVSRGPMAAVTGLRPIEEHAHAGDALRDATEFAARQRARIADDGLAAVVRAAFDTLVAGSGGGTHGALSPRDAGRLARVVAIAEDLSGAGNGAVAGAPPARTLELIEAIEADKADASSSDKVRVMTVHKSKGLEFDEVILPSLEKGWGAAPTGWGMLVTSPTEPPRLVAPLLNDDVRRWLPELSLFERDERRRRILDDLSALYVALTRAKSGLHLVVSKPKAPAAKPAAGKRASRAKSSGSTSLPTSARLIMTAVDGVAGADDTLGAAGAITTAFQDATSNGDEPFWKVEYGAMKSKGAAAAGESRGAEGASDAEPLIVVVPHASGNAAPPSMHEAHDPWQFDPFGDDDVAVRGVLVHECFREVRSVEAIATDAQRVALLERARRRAAVEKGRPIGGDADSQAMLAGVRSLLERCATGPVAEALRPAADTRVLTELPFVRETANGLVHGRIDRLELLGDLRGGGSRGASGGPPRGAVIVDYKTGAVGSSGERFAATQRDYFEQLEGYAAAVGEMYGLSRSAIRLRLVFVDRGEVIEGA